MEALWGHKTVLIVDDVDIMRQLLAAILKQYGFNNIVQASHGDRALELAKALTIDLAFLDINMPGLGGLEVLRELKKFSPQVFSVMLTAEGTLQNVQKAKEYGVDAFLVKPCRPAKIGEVVQKYIRTQTVAR